ncbi:type II toxin-antitoxin system HicB family antitoxin [Patescibacteria group bacterium]|nr:type II toxin-antitoxin system HicB family antitoxin [Patescibacteria group bacterium]
MKVQSLNYRIIVEKEKQNDRYVYVAYAPSLGISDFGPTIDKAVSNMEHAMELYITTLNELNQPIPEPDKDDYYVTTRKIVMNPSISINI